MLHVNHLNIDADVSGVKVNHPKFNELKVQSSIKWKNSEITLKTTNRKWAPRAASAHLWPWLWPCRIHCRRRWWPCRGNRRRRVWRPGWRPDRPSRQRSWSWCCRPKSAPSCPSSTGSSEGRSHARDTWGSACRPRPPSPVWEGRRTPEASWPLWGRRRQFGVQPAVLGSAFKLTKLDHKQWSNRLYLQKIIKLTKLMFSCNYLLSFTVKLRKHKVRIRVFSKLLS